MLPLRQQKLGRELNMIHTCVRVGETGKNQEYKITEPKARITQNPTGTRTDGGTWISLIVVLLSMFFMKGKAVGHLDFVHSPPSLPSGQRVHPLRQPSSYHGIKSGASCHPSIQMLHNSTPIWTGLCASSPHQTTSLGQLARPSTSGFAINHLTYIQRQ